MATGLQKRKILITGKNGQLAREIIKNLEKENADIYAYSRKELDITDYTALTECFLSVKPEIAINCAAYNFVDKAETERKQALNTNAEAPGKMAQLCEKIGAFLVHFGTDYVFDGEKNSPYTEKDRENPVNYYGETKLKGEKEIAKQTENYLIMRVSWLYGEGKNNFVYKFLNWANNNQKLKITEDETSVPTYAKTVATLTITALKENLKGLFHCVNSGFVSRYDFAETIKRELKLETEIEPVPSSFFNLPAKRPKFSAMDNKSISAVLNTSIPHWEDDLKRFLKEFSWQL